MAEATATRKRGRPKTGNTKTLAQRQREYRIRKKAGLVKIKTVTRDDPPWFPASEPIFWGRC